MIKSTYNPSEDIDDNPISSQIDPDRLFLIIFLKGSPTIYRTWIYKSSLEAFRMRLYDAADTLSPKKKFFEFGRRDEIDLTQIAGYQSRPYLISQESDQ